MSLSVKVVEAGKASGVSQATFLQEREVAAECPMPAVPSMTISNLYYSDVVPADSETQHNTAPY